MHVIIWHNLFESSVLAERVGLGGRWVGVTLCVTWRLLQLAVEMPWLAPGWLYLFLSCKQQVASLPARYRSYTALPSRQKIVGTVVSISVMFYCTLQGSLSQGNTQQKNWLF